MTGNDHARFWIGGRGSNPFADHTGVQWKASRLRTVPCPRKSLHKLACELGGLSHMTDVTARQLDQVPTELLSQFHVYFIGWIIEANEPAFSR